MYSLFKRVHNYTSDFNHGPKQLNKKELSKLNIDLVNKLCKDKTHILDFRKANLIFGTVYREDTILHYFAWTPSSQYCGYILDKSIGVCDIRRVMSPTNYKYADKIILAYFKTSI